MPSRKKILGAILLAAVIYVVLILPWPGVRQVYRDGYRFVASLMLGHFGDEATVRYRLPTAQEQAKHTASAEPGDLVAEMERRRTIWGKVQRPDGTIGTRPGTDVVRLQMVVPTGRVGFVPTIELIALVLASPVTWSRKGRALVLGLLIVNAFVLFRLGVFLYFHFTNQPSLQLSEPGRFMQSVVPFAHDFLFVSPTCSFLVPVIIWIAVTFRRGDWLSTSGSPPDAAQSTSRPAAKCSES